MTRRGLRTGFTTGTCAAAAAKAAALAALGGSPFEGHVEVDLPGGGAARIAAGRCEMIPGGARCSVVKDGGDDPDVTSGALIVSEVLPGGPPGDVRILGGEGVGTVTKPGLGLEIGGPAINPVPRRMIERSVRGALRGGGAAVTVSVPAGRELAPKTDNPRLGIVGGISILGTSGIVVPFSTASFAASIRQGIDVAVAAGDGGLVVLTTGGRSEEFARRAAGPLPDHCFVQMGDFAGYAVEQCAKKGVGEVLLAGFVGKLAKMAAGASQTHVKGSKVDTAMLARLAAEAGLSPGTAEAVRGANTARHAMEVVVGREPGAGAGAFFGLVCERVRGRMAARAGGMGVGVAMFDFEGGVLACRRERGARPLPAADAGPGGGSASYFTK